MLITTLFTKSKYVLGLVVHRSRVEKANVIDMCGTILNLKSSVLHSFATKWVDLEAIMLNEVSQLTIVK